MVLFIPMSTALLNEFHTYTCLARVTQAFALRFHEKTPMLEPVLWTALVLGCTELKKDEVAEEPPEGLVLKEQLPA
jgi:hypothetical protein